MTDTSPAALAEEMLKYPGNYILSKEKRLAVIRILQVAIPDKPAGSELYARTSDGRWFYIDHLGKWRRCPHDFTGPHYGSTK